MTPGDLTPVGSATAAPLGSGAVVGDQHVAEALVHLNRAVQRATIYPQGHPAIAAATGPAVSALQLVLSETSLTIVVTKDRLLAARGAAPPTAQAVPWLTNRLRDRRVATLVIEDEGDGVDVAGLVAWLARAADPTTPDDVPALSGIRVTPVDYSGVRFSDGPFDNPKCRTDAGLAWTSMVAYLTDGLGVVPPGDRITDPDQLADAVRDALHAYEGTGTTTLSSRLLAVGRQMGALSDQVRAGIREKLAALVGRLAPELRGQLLSVGAGDPPEKLALLEDLVDGLPREALLEIVRNLDLDTAGAPRQLGTLLGKLVAVAATDEPLAGALAERLGPMRSRAATGAIDPVQVGGIVDTLFKNHTGSASYVPSSYQQRLDQLTGRTGGSRTYDVAHLASAEVASATRAQVCAIALHLAESDARGPGARTGLAQLARLVPLLVEDANYHLAARAARVGQDLLRTAGDAKDTRDAARELMAVYGQEDVTTGVLDALEAEGHDGDGDLLTLLEAGGSATAIALLRRAEETPRAASRERLTRALASLPSLRLSPAGHSVLAESPRSARALLQTAREAGASWLEDLAAALVGHEAPDVRLSAFEALFDVRVSQGPFDRLLAQALDDSDPHIVGLGLMRADAARRPSVCEVLGRFVAVARGQALAPLQRRAVAALVADKTPASRQALVAALRARRWLFGSGDRAVSRAIAAALHASNDAAAQRVARRWRRSLAGLVSLLLSRPKEVA